MKDLSGYKAFVLLILIFIFPFVSTCQSNVEDESTGKGTLNLYLHDAPAVGVEEVNVVITGINIINSAGDYFLDPK